MPLIASRRSGRRVAGSIVPMYPPSDAVGSMETAFATAAKSSLFFRRSRTRSAWLEESTTMIRNSTSGGRAERAWGQACPLIQGNRSAEIRARNIALRECTEGRFMVVMGQLGTEARPRQPRTEAARNSEYYSIILGKRLPYAAVWKC